MHLERVNRVSDGFVAHLSDEHDQTARLTANTIDGLHALVLRLVDLDENGLSQVNDIFTCLVGGEFVYQRRRGLELREDQRMLGV